MDLVKEVSKYIAELLALLVNQLFQNSCFPRNLMYAELKPLFKKGDRHNSDKYRPVSLLPEFSSYLKILIKEQKFV